MSDIVTHEYNENGGHRVRVGMETGEWSAYEHPAELLLADGRTVIAFTDYYAERVLIAKPVADAKMNQVCSQCGASIKWDAQGNFVEGCEHFKKHVESIIRLYRYAEK